MSYFIPSFIQPLANAFSVYKPEELSYKQGNKM